MVSLAQSLQQKLAIPPAERKLSDIFEEQPVDLTTFVTHKGFLANPPLSAIQYDFLRHLEQIYFPQTYALMAQEFDKYWEPVRFVNFLYLEWGKGSGKDHLCRLGSLRVAYLLMCLRSPHEYFEMPPQDSFHLLNVASSSSQATRAFFQPMVRAVERKGSWFYGKCSPSQQSILYDKNIEAVSGHSDSETQEGLNLMLGIADEISAFKTKDEIEQRYRGAREPATSSEAIMNLLRTSARTRFPFNFKNVAISYPRFKGDAIQQLVNNGISDNRKYGEESRVYVSGPLPTWEVNPRVKSKEDFKDDYEKDAANARAKYECLPELSVNRFFRNDTAIHGAFNKVLDREPIEVSYVWKVAERDKVLLELMPDDTEASLAVPGWQAVFDIDPNFRPIAGAKYALHGDIGLTGDRAGLAMCHVRKWEERIWLGSGEEAEDVEINESRPIIKLDFVLAFEADISAKPQPREVQIRWYRELCWDLIRRGFNIKWYSYDGFQSTDSMQILKSRGIESERVSTDLRPEVVGQLRDVVYDGRLEAYYHELAINEIASLHRKANGKIDHPPYGSKDLADSIAGAVNGAIQLGGREGDIPEEAFPGSNLAEAFAPLMMPETMDTSLQLVRPR